MPKPELPSMPQDLPQKIQRALDMYDGKVKNQPKSLSKGFFSPVSPSKPMEAIRALNKRLDAKEAKEDKLDEETIKILEEIRGIISNDPNYPRADSATTKAELILDYLLFDGAVFMAKCNWNLFFRGAEEPTDGDKHHFFIRRLMQKNLIHFANTGFIETFLAEDLDAHRLKLNQTFIETVANAAVESSLFMVDHFPEHIDLSTEANHHFKNNALLVAIAKGRTHKDSGKGSTATMDSVIDALFQHPSVKAILDMQDSSPNIQMTALHLAVLQGDHVSVKNLLDLGANPNSVDYNDKTPLYYFENISYKEAQEHLAAYTQGSDRENYIVQRAGSTIMEKAEDALYPTFTMPKKSSWAAGKQECANLLLAKGAVLEVPESAESVEFKSSLSH